MRLFKKKAKTMLSDILSGLRALQECILDNFRALAADNCITYRKKDGKPKRQQKPKEALSAIKEQQERFIEYKMKQAYGNLGIVKLPADWKETNQYRIFKRSNLVQIAGYAESMIKNLKPKAYLTAAGIDRCTDIGLDKAFLTAEVEAAKNEIDVIDKELISYNTTTAVE
jgi:hypothetical protein